MDRERIRKHCRDVMLLLDTHDECAAENAGELLADLLLSELSFERTILTFIEKASALMGPITDLINRAVDDLNRLSAQNASLQTDNAAKDATIADLQGQLATAGNNNTATDADVANLTSAVTTAEAQLGQPAAPPVEPAPPQA